MQRRTLERKPAFEKMQKKHGSQKRRLSGMQIASIVLGALLLLGTLSFGGYVLYQNEMHRRALENYPTAYTDFIKSGAEEFALDPYLVTSIMRCESSFDPDAVSKRGAIGLMQIMPDTGAWIAHKLDLDDSYMESQLYDPATNVRFACWYLRFLNSRFDGNTKQIIAAYNAGHGSVEGWLEDERFSLNGELLTIPFEETARYYEKVTAAYDAYVSLYPALYTEAQPTADNGAVAG